MSDGIESATQVVALLLLAVVLAVLARWGRGHAHLLVPGHLDVSDRDRRASTLRRGALACYGATLVLVCTAVLAVV
jgi:hypothetical protein